MDLAVDQDSSPKEMDEANTEHFHADPTATDPEEKNGSSDSGVAENAENLLENEVSDIPVDPVPHQDSGSNEMDETSTEHPDTELAVSGAEEMDENVSSDSGTDSLDNVELPSNVIDRKQIFMPMDLKSDDPRIYGKWLWFSNGDIHMQDQVWIQLASLILDGLVILQESSTVKGFRDRNSLQGVIKCYTREDENTIKKAGLAIQKIVGDRVILYYKSNKASADLQGRKYGDRFISEYMLTACGRLYAKDKFNRWKVVDSKSEISVENRPCQWSSLTNLKPMPSQEYFRCRYFYPDSGGMREFDGSWTLFCRIDDADHRGRSELDRVFALAKMLVDDRMLSSTSCETLAFNVKVPRRSVHCVVNDPSDISQLVRPIDRIRAETDYDYPVYLKMCHLVGGRKVFLLKYLYTEARELYEYVNECWQLVARGEALDAHT